MRPVLSDHQLAAVAGGVIAGTPSSAHPAVGYLVDEFGKPHCTGQLVTPDTVLSAAHCWDGPSRLRFVLGEYSPDNRVYEPREIGNDTYPFVIRHPQYDGERHDLAYVSLTEPVQGISADQLAVPRSDIDVMGKNLELVGYGKTIAGPADTDEGFTFERKLAGVQANGRDDELQMTAAVGLDGSVCAGDSGAGFFEPGTENLVGVLKGRGADGPCGVGEPIRFTNLADESAFVNEAMNAASMPDTGEERAARQQAPVDATETTGDVVPEAVPEPAAMEGPL